MMYFVATRLAVDPRSEQGKARYAGLVNAIQALGPWSDRMDRVWLVESKLSASRIRTLLKPHVANNERIFVGQFSNNWAGYNMGQGFPDWIGRRDFDVPKAPSRSKRQKKS